MSTAFAVRRTALLVISVALALIAASLGGAPATAAPATPDGLSPDATSVEGLPVLAWDRVAGAGTYDVQVATSPTFNEPLWTASTTNRRATPTVQLPGGTIYWRVRASASSGSSSWRQASFSRSALAGPSPTGPADGALLDPPEDPALLSWEPVPGAIQYTLEVGRDPNFVDATLVKTYTTKTTSFVVPDPVVATEYSWRVRATLGTGVVTDWSVVRDYTLGGLDKPVLQSPASSPTTNVVDVVLDWEPVMGARTYNLQISTDRNFNTVDHSITNVTSTRYSPPTTLNNDQYYWRVTPVDSAANTLDWDDVDVWEFRRHWPDQPVLEYPAHNALVGDPFFYQWTPVRNASAYRVEVSSAPDFSTIYDTCITVQTTLVPTKDKDCFPQALGTYYWRVIGLDSPQDPPVVTDSIAAQVRRFSYNPALVTTTAPASGAEVSVPTLRWEPVAGASEYIVTLTRTDTGSVITDTTTGTSWTSRVALGVGKTYRWDVRAVSESDRVGPALLPGSQPTFTVVAPTATTGPTPEPVTPDGQVSARFPTLEWTPVSTATQYQVFVRRAGSITWTALGDKFAYPAGEDSGAAWLSPDTYEWRVDAFAGNTFLSGSAGHGTFVIAPSAAVTGHRVALSGTAAGSPATSCSKALTDPQAPIADQQCQGIRATPVLRWDAEPNTGYYNVWLSRDRELTNVIRTYPTEQPMFIPTEALIDSQAGSAFYWWVQPCKVGGICRAPQYAGHAFNKVSKAVQLQSPADGATVSNAVTLTWRDYLATNQDATTDGGNHLGVHSVEPDVEAYTYRVQVDNDPNFQSPIDDVEVDQTTYTDFANTYPEGPLYWRVRAIDGSLNPLSWSTPRSFTKLSPTVALVGPTGNVATNGVDPLRWQPLAYAASYDVEVYRNADTIGQSFNRVFSGNSKQIAMSPTTPFPVSAQSYTWRVRPRDAENRPGQWTDLAAPAARFRVTGTPPTLTGPGAGTLQAGNDLLFSWTAVPGAADYRLERRLANGAGSASSVRTPMLAYAPSTVGDGVWEWRVVALDNNAAEIGASVWREFTVDSTGPRVVAYRPGSTARRTSNFTVTFDEPTREIRNATFKITPAGSRRALSAVVRPSEDRMTATLNPAASLKPRRTYVVKLTSKITDDAGNPLTPVSWSVTTR